MTHDAQNALRRVIEKYADNARFCIICNYLSKIIPPLQSRCTRFRFGPLSTDQMIPRIEHVIREENVPITPAGKQAIVDLAEGDMRKSLNILQAAHMAFGDAGKIDEREVYQCVGAPQESVISDIMTHLMNDDVTTAFNQVQDIKTTKSLALVDIVQRVHLSIMKLKLDAKVKIFLLSKLGDLEKRLAAGSSESIQLASLVSIMHQARQLI